MTETKELEKIINELCDKLKDSVTINTNFAKIVKLLIENTIPKDKKLEIVERFNQVKTIEEGEILYNTILNELKNKEKMNITEILKDAPKGLELYSTVYGHVKFTGLKDTNIQENAIAVVDEDGINRYFSENGYLSRHGEMLLFPSYHDYLNGYGWGNWESSLLPKSVGSVVVDEDFEGLFLITSKNTLCDSAGMEFETLWKRLRYATKEESEQFFDNLEYHGYRYDNELKQVLNIKCEFKIGDTIRRKDNEETFKIVGKDITVYTPPASPTFKLSNGDWISFQALKENYVLVENTANNDKDTQNQCERFTINDFHPFDKVLARFNQDEWHIDFFERIDHDGDTGIDYYTCMLDAYRQCVPYNEETQYLLGTTEEYNGNYKTW